MLWGWDVEAREWDQVVCVVLCSEHGDVVRLWGPDALERAWDHMQTTKGTYVAHYGGGYDVPLMLNVHKFRRIVLSGSNILTAEEGRDLKLRDTFPWWLAGLKKVGEAVGRPKMEVDRSAIGALSQAEVLDYCENDVKVLLDGVQAARQFLDERGADRAWTAGASAVSLLRAFEPGTWNALRRHALLVDDVKAALPSVRGGRVDCPARGFKPAVYSYDFKSSYPARYARSDLPIGLRRASSTDRGDGVWRCRWEWKDRQRIPPAVDSATQCGVGACEAWLIAEEIALFEQCGVKVRRLEGWVPELTLPIGHTFAEKMFAAKEGKGASRFFAKVWLNSLHGKFSEDPIKESYTLDRPKKWLGEDPELLGSWWRYLELRVGDDGKAAPHAQPLAAATILGRARAALWRVIDALQMGGWQVYYCDTDSVMTDCPPNRMPVQLGVGLGELAYEAGPCRGYFLGPKAYLLVDDADVVVKSALKGVPFKSLVDGVREDGVYREARRESGETGSDLRLSLFQQVMREGAARCWKDGVTSFLRGLRGTADAHGNVLTETWRRAPFVRTIRPSGRGRSWGPQGEWQYMTTLETAIARELEALPCSIKAWEGRPDLPRESSERKGFIARERGQVVLSQIGRDWLALWGHVDSGVDVADDDERDEAADTNLD